MPGRTGACTHRAMRGGRHSYGRASALSWLFGTLLRARIERHRRRLVQLFIAFWAVSYPIYFVVRAA